VPILLKVSFSTGGSAVKVMATLATIPHLLHNNLFVGTVLHLHPSHSSCIKKAYGAVWLSIGYGVAQAVALWLAVRLARVQISAWHSRGGPLPSRNHVDNKTVLDE
jgi:hypothetical protein